MAERVSFEEFIKRLKTAKPRTWGVVWMEDGLVLKISGHGGIIEYPSPNPADCDSLEFFHFCTRVNDIMEVRGGK